MKEMTLRELAEYNGQNGKPVYIAHEGRVFDVTGSELWSGGSHMYSHRAGGDLTEEIGGAPHGPEMLERYPQVAVLKAEEPVRKETVLPERRIPDLLSRLLGKYPMLRRHPHPMTVHFPIVFMFSVSIFTILYLLTGLTAFDVTAATCLGAGLLFTPVAMATGYYTWWLNYLTRPIRAVRIKQVLSFILLAIEIFAFVLRMAVPDILHPLRAASGVYLILVLAVLPIVTIIGWYGASLTFPVEKNK